MELMIDGGTIVTMGSKGIIRDGAVIIEDGRIINIGKSHKLKQKYTRYEKINTKGKVVIPGLINTHQHAAMSLLRGYADDYPLKQWLEDWIWPLEKHMTGHDIYVGALLTAIESIMGGTTTVNTMYHYMNEHNEAKAFADAGLRGIVGHVCFSWRKKEDKKALGALTKNWHNKANGLIRTSVDPHAPYTVDPEYMKELHDITRELNRKFGSPDTPIIRHMHVAETSDEIEKIKQTFDVSLEGGVIEYLDSLEVLERDIIASHCVTLTPKDVKILKEKKVKVSHNPISNLKLASGISPVPDLKKIGVTVALGTDSPCSNNNADMFNVMKTTAIMHKGVNQDPTLLPAEQILMMATIEGAKALLWDNEIGSIEIGKDADLVILDFKKPHLYPLHNEVSHLVYSAGTADVDTVLIKGEITMENREIKTVDVHRVLELAEKTKESLLKRLTENSSQTAKSDSNGRLQNQRPKFSSTRKTPGRMGIHPHASPQPDKTSI